MINFVFFKRKISAEYSSAVAFAAFRKRQFGGENLILLTGHGIKNT